MFYSAMYVIGWGLAYLFACKDSVGVRGVGIGSREALFWQGGGTESTEVMAFLSFLDTKWSLHSDDQGFLSLRKPKRTQDLDFCPLHQPTANNSLFAVFRADVHRWL